MALTWDVKNVKDFNDVCWQEATEDVPSMGIVKGESYLSPVTNALIWQSLSTGIGRITEANVAEVWARISLLEELYGASLRNSEGPRPITMEEVRQHIGLTTNVSYKDETRASFMKRHVVAYLDAQKRSYETTTAQPELARR